MNYAVIQVYWIMDVLPSQDSPVYAGLQEQLQLTSAT